jgi:probable rRNA maturation factor
MSIGIIDRLKAPEVDRRAVRRLIRRILKEHGRADEDVTVVFAADEFVRELNASYRGTDRVTDVLAFNMGRIPRRGRAPGPEGGEAILGDVIVSVERARVQARRYKRTTEREILKLVAHGTLHLLGHDHETSGDRASMRRLENRYVREADASRAGAPERKRRRS